MTATQAPGKAVGAPISRVEGGLKVRGAATYAYEHRLHEPVYLYPLQSTIANGRVTKIDASRAEAEPGVVVVLTHENAPKLASTDDKELAILQSGDIGFRGQFIGAVIADTFETARYAASLVEIEYDENEPDADFRADRDDLYTPEQLNAGFETDTSVGDADGAFDSAAHKLAATYTTPREHNNPMEPHATIAVWDEDELTLYESTQGVFWTQKTLAPLFGLDAGKVHVISPHVGGGFGSKGLPHANVVLAAMGAMLVPERPVKFALTRHMMFTVAGYRTPTIQRVRLAADENGKLSAVSNDVVEQTSKIKEFAEQTATSARMMYDSPNIKTTHRLAALDVSVPSWLRAPGEAPGIFALECAMDELAIECGLDPVEFRIMNEPENDPESGLPFSSRGLVECLREGAERFGWNGRHPTPRSERDGRWLVGSGVASSVYPVYSMGGNAATVRANSDGKYEVEIGAADIGTGTWTVLGQIAADELGVPFEDVEMKIGDTTLPNASGAGGSSGITSWGSTVVEAVRSLREKIEADHGGNIPEEGVEATAKMPKNPHSGDFAMYAFGAHFVEARVDEDTGEVRVPRMTSVFAAGNIMNAKTARSQFMGGMVMGLSAALHEESVLDTRFGHVVNHDLAEYHIPTNADVGEMDVSWIEEDDPYVNPMGSKGIGEIGIVGSAAAVANAVYHATGVRVRELPITPDKLIS
ncbi:MAG: xanthine dehydrogenase family protein molybdopterin-binding subunit [Rubrobacter sp.]|nr:xanthine dehydrogenase family protein molybdopterin-binding subunit [Rubrobacter sp.]